MELKGDKSELGDLSGYTIEAVIEMAEALAAYHNTLPGNDPLAPWRVTLRGGDPDAVDDAVTDTDELKLERAQFQILLGGNFMQRGGGRHIQLFELVTNESEGEWRTENRSTGFLQ